MKNRKVFEAENGNWVRIPSVVADPEGRVYAFANRRVGTHSDHADETEVVLRVRERDGEWGREMRFFRPGWSYMIGSAVCDENTGKVFCHFMKIAVTEPEFQKILPPGERDRLAREKELRDGEKEGCYVIEGSGECFSVRPVTITPNPEAKGHFFAAGTGFSHGSGAGITIKRGQYAGRLVVPARFNLHDTVRWEDLKTGSTNTVIWSDDHGESWHTGGTVEPGTGEGTLSELSDGSIYLNSRAYFGDGFRRDAVSRDGGATFTEQRRCSDLIEPCCNAAVVRAEWKGKEILFFSNPHSTSERVDMTVHYSTDGGKSWQYGLRVDNRKASYSSLAYDREREELILLYECGTETCIDEVDEAILPVGEVAAEA